MLMSQVKQEGNRNYMGDQVLVLEDEKQNCYEDLGMRVWHDPITRKQPDNVMGIFYEEQVLTWRLFGDDMLKAIATAQGSVDFMDVGTGSGFWALLLAKHLKNKGVAGKVLGVDKLKRAIEFSEMNMEENGILFDLRYEEYNINSAPQNDVRVIFMNPPYHIYPTTVEDLIPHHARGGGWGYEEFINWLAIADYHLSENGRIFFHHMCLGNDEPESLRFIPKFISGNPSIEYYEIFPPMDSFIFLKNVYRERCASFIYEVAEEFSQLHYASGVIVRDGLGRREKKTVSSDYLEGKSWQDRILLHRSIAEMFSGSELGR